MSESKQHSAEHQQSKIGVLITNLGTPDEPTPKAVRKYLAEFLWDPRVVEIPRPLWWLILNGFVLRTRPKRSAKAYQKIWTDEGSPLLNNTKKQHQALQKIIHNKYPEKVAVAYAMRYGQPSIASALAKFRAANVSKILVLPLYPQYSAATTASTFDAINKQLRQYRFVPEIRTIHQYADDTAYINALVQSIKQQWQTHGQNDVLLFSYHGLPQKFFEQGDPYYCYCSKTTRLVTEVLGLKEDQWRMTFQSRFGAAKWLQPYTDKTLIELAKQGKSVDVICPGFAADCLETLEEINIRNRELFESNGGKQFSYIPALNDNDDHISCLADIVEKNLQGWV